MKNIIQYIGIIILILFSFFYTEKTVATVKNNDPLMLELEEKKDEYNINAINAEINEDKIIPGMIGCVVDKENSYYNLKRLGKFNSNLLEYKIEKPKISINDNYDKYIIRGNKLKNTVTLIFKVNSNVDIKKTVEILNEKKVKASFFITGKYIENNIEIVQNLINEGHEILNYGYDNDYDKDLLIWNNNLIEKLNYNNPKFCYLEKENINTLNICSINKMKTIIPSIITTKKPLIEIKKQIEKGSLISFNINSTTENELNLIINYIKQKGYKIDILSKHLEESIIKTCKNINSGD